LLQLCWVCCTLFTVATL